MFLFVLGVLIQNVSAGEKIVVCHATGSESNPVVKITVSENALSGHANHVNDFLPNEFGECIIDDGGSGPNPV